MTQNLTRYAALSVGLLVTVQDWEDMQAGIPALVRSFSATRVRVSLLDAVTLEPLTADIDVFDRDQIHLHADYPHTPGTLYDCAACERACHCADGTCIQCEEEISTPVEEWEEQAMDAAADYGYPETDLGDEW